MSSGDAPMPPAAPAADAPADLEAAFDDAAGAVDTDDLKAAS